MENENDIIYICPECGRKFKQGEWEVDYNDPAGRMWFTCPCGWEGSEDETETALDC